MLFAFLTSYHYRDQTLKWFFLTSYNREYKILKFLWFVQLIRYDLKLWKRQKFRAGNIMPKFGHANGNARKTQKKHCSFINLKGFHFKLNIPYFRNLIKICTLYLQKPRQLKLLISHRVVWGKIYFITFHVQNITHTIDGLCIRNSLFMFETSLVRRKKKFSNFT